MRVENKQSVNGAEPASAKSVAERPVLRPQTDKVSLHDTKQVEAVVQAVRAGLGSERALRLEELETAIRQGGYQPNASQLAEKIVRAAEIDARLRAIFGG